MRKRDYKPYEVNINTLGFYVDRLLYAMIKRRNLDLMENQMDIMHSEFVIIKVLNALEGASQSELAAIMGKERSGISRVLASLEKKGYIDRKPLNGSTNFVTLTQKGKDLMPKITELSEKLNETTFKGFSEKQRDSVLNYLERLYNNVKE